MHNQDYAAFTDQDLLHLLKEDDEIAFTQVFKRYWKLLYTTAFNIIRDEFVAQDTFFLAITSGTIVAQDINIIPQPSSVQKKQGSFIIKRTTPIVAKSPDEKRSGQYLNAYLNKHYGFSLPIKSSGTAGIVIKAGSGATDSYVLDVDPKKYWLKAIME